jgi:molybdopterin synthase sulfur carrier subunit
MVTVLFLGQLADIAGMAELELPAPMNWAALIGAVNAETVDQLREDRIKVACGGRVLADKRLLNAVDGDEVALMPPVSGG